jgi:hypothetical protein
VNDADEHGLVDGSVGPLPETPISLAVSTQEIAGDDAWLSNPQRQGLPFHSVLHRQHALLEKLALSAVRRLTGVIRYSTGLLGEGEIAVAGLVGCLQSPVARQGSGNADLLLRPVYIGDRVACRRFDQAAQPNTWAKYKLIPIRQERDSRGIPKSPAP